MPSTQPLHRFKADLFRALAHPVRIRILELLREGPESVSDLQTQLGIEASNVSQQLAVLRSRRIVHGTKEGTSVIYSVEDPLVFSLLDTSRQMFETLLQDMLLAAAAEKNPYKDGTP